MITDFFSPLNAPQSGMSQLISTNDHRGDTFLVQGLIGGQTTGKRTGDRPSPTGWGLGMGTIHPIATGHQPKNPEIFIQIGKFVQKLFMIFQNTGGQTDGQTHKRITPLPYMGTGKKLFALFFLPFHSLCLPHSLRFIQDNYI